jgi:hypothetical protein
MSRYSRDTSRMTAGRDLPQRVAHHRRVPTGRRVVSSALAVLALCAVLPAVAAAVPGTPGVPQAPRTIYSEDFENGVDTTPVLLTSYTGATGATYTADPAWLARCNGAIGVTG